MIKICFIGASGTGKSTLAYEIAREYDDVEISPSFGRSVKDWNLPVSEKGGSDTNLATLALLTEDFFKTNPDCQIKVFPRSWIDGLIFAKDLPSSTYIQIEEKSALVRLWFLESQRHMKDYDLIFYLPKEFETEEDGVRPSDEFNEQYDEDIVTYLEKFSLPYIKLTGSVEERMKVVKEEICKLL